VVTCKIKHFTTFLRPRHKSTALKHFCKCFILHVTTVLVLESNKNCRWTAKPADSWNTGHWTADIPTDGQIGRQMECNANATARRRAITKQKHHPKWRLEITTEALTLRRISTPVIKTWLGLATRWLNSWLTTAFYRTHLSHGGCDHEPPKLCKRTAMHLTPNVGPYILVYRVSTTELTGIFSIKKQWIILF